MKAERIDLKKQGMAAEDWVASQIQRQGWSILGKRVQARGWELDIVAWKDGVLRVIEVKARRFPVRFSYEYQALITTKKKLALRRGIEAFCYRRKLQPITITADLFAVCGDSNGKISMQVFKDVLNG